MSSKPFDLVIMDVHMPGVDGLEVTRWARAQPALVHLTIVAMTANVLEKERRACGEAGMNDFIPEPVDPAALASVLSKWAQPKLR